MASGAEDLTSLRWDEVPRHTLSAEALRTLRYMQAAEAHTIVFPRTIFTRRAADDPVVSTFFVRWLYEETCHGRALAQFLDAAGHPVTPSRIGRLSITDRLEALVSALASRLWPDFLALYMTWGALHELTTLTSYRRVAKRAGHPVLNGLLTRIVRDEARHFAFYFRQARQRLGDRRRTARLVRLLIDRLYKPVGYGVRPAEEMKFVTAYLFDDEEGRAALRAVDERITRLPGFAGARPLQGWVEKLIGPATAHG